MALISVGAVAIWANRADAPSVVGTPDETVVATLTSPGDHDHIDARATVDSARGRRSSGIGIAPDPRGIAQYPSVVWTGSEALVVGGLDADRQLVAGAAAYSPSTNTWRTLADQPYPWFGTRSSRGPVARCSSSEAPSDDGDRYDLTGVRLRPGDGHLASEQGGLSFVTDTSPAAWTGTELLVWPTGTWGNGVHAYDPNRHMATACQRADRPPGAGRVGVERQRVDHLGRD